MSKKDQAFDLFNQGFRPGDPEVKTLALKPKSRYNYYQLWKKSSGATEVIDETGNQPKGLPTTTDT